MQMWSPLVAIHYYNPAGLHARTQKIDVCQEYFVFHTSHFAYFMQIC